MPKPTRIIVAAASLSLSACATVHPPERGLYLSAGMALDSIRLTAPCPTPYACSVSPRFQFVKTNAFGIELGVGYRFNRFLSLQAEGQFAIGGDRSDIRPPLQDNPNATLQVKTFLRPALRADLPLARSLSVYVTYGLQFEDISVHTNNFDTGKIITRINPGYCTTDNTTGKQTCYPAETNQYPEAADNIYHHRDWHGSPTAGFDLYGSDLISLHVEYQPERNGHIGSVVAGASWHF